MAKQVSVKGLRELDRFLSALPKNMQQNAYGAGLRAAAKVVVTEARIRAPKASGKMAKAIKSGSVRRNADGHMAISVRLDPRGNDHAFLGLFHEYGVAPHYINAGNADVSARKLTQSVRRGGDDAGADVLVINGSLVSGAVLHPGHAAQPFLRPALDIRADEAVRAFAGAVKGYLEGKTGFIAPGLDEAA